MSSLQEIQAFLEPKKMAIAGVSRNKKKFGYTVFSGLKLSGYEVYPVNPFADSIDETPCFRTIEDLPAGIENLLIVTAKSETSSVVEAALKKGIKKIWIQQHSESPEALKLCENSEIPVISNHCIFMFAEPVTGFHKFHRGISKLFRTYPN